MPTSKVIDRAIQLKKERFLEAYSRLGTISHAIKEAGIATRDTHYTWMKDPKYAKDFEAAGENAIEALEREARRRAEKGVEKTFYDKNGRAVGTEIKYSDTLLIFLLKAARPNVYRDNINLTGEVRVELASALTKARKRYLAEMPASRN